MNFNIILVVRIQFFVYFCEYKTFLMVRSLLFSILVMFVTVASAQFTSSPAPVNISTQPSAGESITDVAFSKSGDSTYTIFWKLEKNAATFDPAWELSVCDLNQCYLPFVNSCPPNKPNMVSMNNFMFQLHFTTNGAAGSSVVGFKFFADKNFTQEVYSTNINISSSVTSTKDQNLANIKIFPNPVLDYFQVTNGYSVKKVMIYNIFGKEVKTLFHYNNAQHEVSDLRPGMYVVKLIDEKNKVIKSLKLNKVAGGA